jgi:3-hydroxyacyl-CoA dehydrogenase
MQVSQIGIVGAGAMGSGIAQVVSASGLPVVLQDIEPGQLEAARAHIEQIYRRSVERGRIAAEVAEATLGSVEYTLDYASFSQVDLVIEAVPEEMALKQRVLAQLDQVCRSGAIFATNTSALSIAAMASASGRPRKMIGMHFFNPAHVMRLVEVVRGPQTDQDTVDTVAELARRLDKIPVQVRECPGFVVNRVLMPYLNEAVICLQEGAVKVERLDATMGRGGFGWPMGPCALMDLIGLDVCHHIITYLSLQYGERMREAALLQAMVAAGQLGQKNLIGFYDHTQGVPAPKVNALVQDLQCRGVVDHPGSAFSVDRMMAPLLNEAFRCVEEGVASVGDVDLACVHGLGMQVNRGGELVSMGPLSYADRVGLDLILRQFQDLEMALGPRFAAASILRHKVQVGDLGVKTGRGFRDYVT